MAAEVQTVQESSLGAQPWFSHPLPHLALFRGGAPAKGAPLQLLGPAAVAGRQLLEAATLQEAQLLGPPSLLQDLLLGLELRANTARGSSGGAGLGRTCRDRGAGAQLQARWGDLQVPPHPASTLCWLLWPLVRTEERKGGKAGRRAGAVGGRLLARAQGAQDMVPSAALPRRWLVSGSAPTALWAFTVFQGTACPTLQGVALG